MIFTRHQINVPHTVAFQVIDQGCEVTEGVFGSVIQQDTALIHPRIPDEPLCILRIAATTDNQGQRQLLRQAQSHSFAIEVSAQHENPLRRLHGGEGLTKRP
jgi:hypothetical protein